MKKLLALFITVALCLSVSITLVGCHEKAPWEYDNVEWYSENPIIRFTDSPTSDCEGVLEKDGGILQISMLWGPGHSFRIIDSNKSDGNTPVEEITLLKGKVEYNSSSATLVIKEDNVFDNEFTSIVLYRRDIEQ